MTLRPVSLAILTLLPTLAMAAHADDVRRPYIVQLADKPVASYAGGVAGLNATQPGAGARLNLASQDVQLYTGYLDLKQATVQASIAAAPVQYQYKVVFNGFAALLTDAEVRALQARSDVAAVTADEQRHVLTSYTPTFLGLDSPSGLWSTLGGKGHAGEDVIVAMLDTGIWPESPSFADRLDAGQVPTFDPSGTLAYGAPPAGWHGSCQSGEGFTAADCNNKLIGAQYFDATFVSSGKTIHWTEFKSPRDSIGGNLGHGGHGTHTSSTSAGNNGVPFTIAGINMGAISGMAPRARVAMYKVCWSYVDTTVPPDPTGALNSCFTGDSVAAIEKAVVDGVNVINYSISGGGTINDPVEQAFLHASNAGIFVAAAAGNSGPANAVAHISPWLSTVGASTHDRLLQSTLTLSNAAQYKGASMNVTALPNTPLIRAEDAGVTGANSTNLSLCFSAASNGGLAVLDPAKVSGKIVTCTRGSNARVDKSLAVLQAGGAGMVMVDNGAGLVAEVHSVPTVHVSAADGNIIRAFAQTAGAGSAISTFVTTKGTTLAPVMADFSSRGPNMFDANLLKPDLTAPGVDIFAGVTPELTVAQRANVINGTFVPPPFWASYQGTSMATPHVAGLAALLHQEHPGWTPAAIKSALMTTGTSVFADAQTGLAAGILPWGQGAGHVTPTRAGDPGLVYDAVLADYRKYMCGAGMTAECSAGTVAGYNLNLPSITVSNVIGAQVVNRSVTNVGPTAATYTSAATLPGYSAVVAPASFTLAAGATQAFTVTLARTTSALNAWQYGALVWSDGTHTVRSPLQARSGNPIVAPASLASDRVSGSRLLSVTTGFAGKMTAAIGGMKEVTRTPLVVAQAAGAVGDTTAHVTASCKNNVSGVQTMSFTFPANTVVARFETFNADTDTGAGNDLDLAVLNSSNQLVGYSGNDGSNEAITLTSPAAGVYKVCVIGYAVNNGVSTGFTLSSDVVSRADLLGLKVSMPSTVYIGGTSTVGLSWSGLAPARRYLGGLQLLDTGGVVDSTTVISVDTNSPVPLSNPVGRVVKTDRGI